MAFSARSFVEAISVSAIVLVLRGPAPRGAVPFIGRVVIRSPSIRKNSSGDADRTR